MMRALILTLVMLAAPCVAGEPVPRDILAHQSKLAQYIAAGWKDDEIIAGLRGWFGQEFQIGPDGHAVFVIHRHADGQIYYLHTIGSLPNK